jgi:hypothetical protein
MKTRILVLVLLPLLVLTMAGVSQAWQGRMAGMGDPYGLLHDESDFLIHPSKLAKGKGIRFYGHYRFTYTGVTDWDFDYGFAVSDTSGQEYKHDILVGSALPLGPGRMGFFFEYAVKQEDYDGDWVGMPLELTSNVDNFALRLLYGLPLGGFNIGGEVQFAYRQEENKTWWQFVPINSLFHNFLNVGSIGILPDIKPYMIPYDSQYWEALFKGSIDGDVGPIKTGLAIRGGFIFCGDNDLDYASVGVINENVNLDGDVKGWRIGGDLWARYIFSEDLSLPFLVRIDYLEKARDGDGQGAGNLAGLNFDYTHKETPFKLEVGGGVDKGLAPSTRIAAGLYYHYLQVLDEIQITRSNVVSPYDYDSPDSTEHRVVLKLAGEHELSPVFALRLGVNFFYGWVQADYDSFYPGFPLNDNISMGGNRWGIGGSVGGMVSFNSLTIEPFIAGGYQSLDLSGDEIITGPVFFSNMYDEIRNEWNIGGGFSVLFDVP